MKKQIILFVIVFIIGFGGATFGIKKLKQINNAKNTISHQFGDVLDSLNHVKVYYNGAISNVKGRNTIKGYNLGLKYQCVEFVKRYYYEYYHHKMPDSYGNAKSFFNKSLKDASLNKARNLMQYSNPSKSKPQVGDLLVFDGSFFNEYGHVAILSAISKNEIEIIQQNGGKNAATRLKYPLLKTSEGLWLIKNKRLLGWLRKQ